MAQLNVIWERQVPLYDHAGSGTEAFERLITGGYILGGAVFSPDDYIVLVRFTEDGFVLGSYEDDNEDFESVFFLEQDITRSLIAGLDVNANTDQTTYGLIQPGPPSPSLAWTTTFSGWRWEMHHHQSGGYVSAGYLEDGSVAVSRIDENANEMWDFAWNEGENLFAHSSIVSYTGDIYVPVSVGITDLVLLRLSQGGNLLGQFLIQGNDGDDLLRALDINEGVDGNLKLFGSFPLDVDSTYSILVLSRDGTVVAQGGGFEGESSGVQLQDGGYLGYGGDWTHDEILFIRYDASMNVLWTYSYTLLDESDDIGCDVLVNENGEIVVGGSYKIYTPFHSFSKLFAAKFAEGPGPTASQIDVESYGPDSLEVDAPGQFYWHGELTNNTDAPITTDVWVIVRTPAGYPSEPLRVWEDVTVPALGTFAADLSQPVPAGAEAGDYNYIVRAGEYDPADPAHTIQDYFPVTVTGDVAADMDPPRTRGVVPAPLPSPRQSR